MFIIKKSECSKTITNRGKIKFALSGKYKHELNSSYRHRSHVVLVSPDCFSVTHTAHAHLSTTPGLLVKFFSALAKL